MKDYGEENQKHASAIVFSELKWKLCSSPAPLSSLVFKRPRWKIGHGLCQAETGRSTDSGICFREGYDDVSSKYSPDCCQHELLFLLSQSRGRVEGPAVDANWIGGMSG